MCSAAAEHGVCRPIVRVRTARGRSLLRRPVARLRATGRKARSPGYGCLSSPAAENFLTGCEFDDKDEILLSMFAKMYFLIRSLFGGVY